MNHKHVFTILLVTVLLLICPITVRADSGPKPSVNIRFTGIEGQDYYVTLLSKTQSTGPYSTDQAHVIPDYVKEELGEAANQIWKAFQDYADQCDYYFLGYVKKSNEEQTFSWGYYPPEDFIVVIYFPEKKGCIESTAQKRYAFDSYYVMDVNAEHQTGNSSLVKDPSMQAQESIQGESLTENYTAAIHADYTRQILGFFIRLVITLATELFLALLFLIIQKRELFTILFTNIVTQIFLNVMLSVLGYRFGFYSFIVNYIWLEFIIVAVEGFVYFLAFRRSDKIRKWTPVIYAVVANAASFGVGFYSGGFFRV